MFEEFQIKRPALGNVGFIGELYDVRNETLSSQSILKSMYPENLVRTTEVSSFDFDYKFTENISDRFELFNVEGTVQISILFGLIKLEGSGKFLTHDKKSDKTVSCSLKAQILTVKEKLFGSFEEIKEYLDLSTLASSQHTHMITEIQWGATCLLNLEYTYSSESNKEEILGGLAGEFSKLKVVTVSGAAELTKNRSDLFSKNGIDIKILSDVVPKNGWPTTVEGFFHFVKEIPSLLKKLNNGKGKPQSYCMVPLSTIRKLSKTNCSMEVLVRDIDESFLVTTIGFLEEVLQIKRKLQDLKSEVKEGKKYVTEKESKEVDHKISVLLETESQFKHCISRDWVSVRSGKKDLKDLIRWIEEYKNQQFNLSTYEKFIDSYSSLRKKLSTIKSYLSQEILYLGKDDKFKTVQNNHLSSEFIVLVISSKIEEADPKLCTNTQNFFLKTASKKEPNFVYVVVDLDYSEDEMFLGTKITEAKCFHLNGVEIINSDMYQEFVAESESCFIRLQKDSKMNLSAVKPGDRTKLELPCPLRCTLDSMVWKCHTCKTIVEYGFDDNYYCACGNAPVEYFQYRCSSKKHDDFVSPNNGEFVKGHLSKLRPFKEINILLVGQSGVGKSTWINSIVNYLSYETLAEAKSCGIITTIPLTLTTYDSTRNENLELHIKGKASNEVTEAGKSATQTSQTYTFPWDGHLVKLIDTPGLGDSRGIEQDKINLDNIIHHLGFFKEIHGLCILLKASDNRYNALYVYCLKELLAHLHRDVVKNIVFCFTNARSTFYGHGTGTAMLKKIIEGLDVRKDFRLGEHTMYFLDNEAFLYLCSLQDSQTRLNEDMEESFAKSWEISSKETKRLFDAIRNLQPHLLKETLSLVMTRRRILSLTKPIAEISKALKTNLLLMEKKQEEIAKSELTLEELAKTLSITVMQLKPVALTHPRTVCTSASCISYFVHKFTGVQEIEYNRNCHSRCYLKDITPKTINNPSLKNCSAFKDGECKLCECSWENHMHITFLSKREEVTIENPHVKKDITKAKNEKEEVEKFLKDLKAEMEQYKKEESIIIDTSVKFGSFLKNNSIASYNDAVSDYIEYLIREEENKPDKTDVEKQLLNNLKNMLEQYKVEVDIIQKVCEQGQGQSEELTAEAVLELEKKLFSLPVYGKVLQEFADINRFAENKIGIYSEIPISLRKPNNRGSLYSVAKKRLNKAVGYIFKIYNSL